tara:strand:- start:2056 stop:2226 length:171 start_codon:yes stop_codon:yes gene_type:complete
MNAQQRRKQKRAGVRMANHLIVILAEALDEIESGKTTVDKMRNQLYEVKEELLKLS